MDYRFQHLGQILRYYRDCNPARQKPVNYLEPERHTTKERFAVQVRALNGDVGVIEDPGALWNFICLRIRRVFRDIGYTSLPIKAFTLVYMLPPDYAMHPRDVAQGYYPAYIPQHYRIPVRSKTTIYEYLSQVREELEQEFIDANLLNPESQNYH